MNTTPTPNTDTVFDQTLANQFTALLNAYSQVGDFEARDALLRLAETHDADDPIVATTISAGLEYFHVWSNQ